MKVIVIDNYDSFTYNLVAQIKKEGATVTVYRNDDERLLQPLACDALVISPGPGIPDEAGCLKKLLSDQLHRLPIFGVCLGHQAIVEVCSGEIVNLKKVFHGVATSVNVLDQQEVLFSEQAARFEVGRYHSWVAAQPLPTDLIAIATDDAGEIMAVKHRTLPVYGVQFHPESVLTPSGQQLMHNFLHKVVSKSPTAPLIKTVSP